MKPSIGRIVIVVASQLVNFNGTNRAPAIVTRNWNEQGDTQLGPVTVNVAVFPDCAPQTALSSIPVYDSEEAAAAAGQTDYFAFSPPRT